MKTIPFIKIRSCWKYNEFTATFDKDHIDQRVASTGSHSCYYRSTQPQHHVTKTCRTWRSKAWRSCCLALQQPWRHIDWFTGKHFALVALLFTSSPNNFVYELEPSHTHTNWLIQLLISSKIQQTHEKILLKKSRGGHWKHGYNTVLLGFCFFFFFLMVFFNGTTFNTQIKVSSERQQKNHETRSAYKTQHTQHATCIRKNNGDRELEERLLNGNRERERGIWGGNGGLWKKAKHANSPLIIW